MIVYHASDRAIPAPDLLHSRKNVDFGPGFYTTPLYAQAAKWSERFKRRGGRAAISVYRFEEEAADRLRTLSFPSYSEEWLDFIITCRSGRDETDYDLVSGGIANDKVFNTVELYLDGLIGKDEAIGRLRFEQPNMQLCFRSEAALRLLRFERSEEL